MPRHFQIFVLFNLVTAVEPEFRNGLEQEATEGTESGTWIERRMKTFFLRLPATSPSLSVSSVLSCSTNFGFRVYPHLSPHLKGGIPQGGMVGYKDGHVSWRKFKDMIPRTTSGSVFWW